MDIFILLVIWFFVWALTKLYNTKPRVDAILVFGMLVVALWAIVLVVHPHPFIVVR